ncbi:MAG: SUF system NifU family Fe-S cluster assembly protein [Coxiellaceae bacterium]|nr:SUF system NifU family Fe-S cluster assembly protein [Coxiellaceae bacterium]
MTNLNELYQELIIDHGRHPRNFKQLLNPTTQKEGLNPLCGDRLTLFLEIENEVILNVSFEGAGCAISMASASLMTESLKGKKIADAKKLFDAFHQMVTGHAADETLLGKLAVLKGVCEYPMRVKCATLAWHTAMAAIAQSQDPVSTE